MGRVIAAIAVLLLLTGCVPTREVPTSGPTDAELQKFLDQQVDFLWVNSGLPDEQRPANPEPTFIGAEDWAVSLATCMNDLGHDNYVAEDNGLSTSPAVGDAEESLDWFLCQATYQFDPAQYELWSGAQLDYLYDYNRSVLVPCLEAHGEAVTFAPTREQAATVGGEFSGWNPYFWNWENFSPKTSARDKHISESCPPFPAGEPFDEMREIWR